LKNNPYRDNVRVGEKSNHSVFFGYRRHV
jgi:hypothetical protein